ncbi:MAG: helix-turn-helix domain-containing protein, partial [Pseudomonadota bacterium]|nr:helix-turn-helix domain-containing protein [Pseudomonadota bacterium]
MRFADIGQQLRAYRLETGLRAEEIASRLGVSRAALYRYEKGDVIKLDTVKRMAELLKISPLSLMGVGVEYYGRPSGYFERLRQVEEAADHILLAYAPFCYLTTSDRFDTVLAAAFDEAASARGPERGQAAAAAQQVLGILAARRRLYAQRRPGIIAIFSLSAVRAFLRLGVAGQMPLSDGMRQRCRDTAIAEVEGMADLMESEPMGLQFGVVPQGEGGSFELLRSRDRATLAVNPFRPDAPPLAYSSVAIITAADDAVAIHQRVAETLWREAAKGKQAATQLRELLAKP